MAAPRIAVPETAAKGEIIQIRTLISHPMDNGYMYGLDGERIPRHIIHTFFVTYNGVEIFRANMFPAQSANPYLVFHTRAVESGTLEFTWLDDHGATFTGSKDIVVT
jgi:sulfur-oxidizing protein SoxZ